MSHPVLFCHGLESGPVGRKSEALREQGWSVATPDHRGLDLPARIAAIVAYLTSAEAGARPLPVVVGSSFGGIAALAATIVAARDGRVVPGLVLCAPALQRSLHEGLVDSLSPPCPTIVIHGRRDDVVPIALSRTFAEDPAVTLHEVDDDHRLGDAGLPLILAAVQSLAGPPSRE